MKIFFEQIKQDGNIIETCLEFNIDDVTFSIKNFKGKLYPLKKGYILDGDIKLAISDKCDRCLKIFDEEFNEHITVEIIRELPAVDDIDTEKELEEEDLGFYHIKEDFIDIHEILYQESVLIRPMKRLCSEDCKGICPVCGNNLNEDRCNCTKSLDNRWEALAKLLQNNK